MIEFWLAAALVPAIVSTPSAAAAACRFLRRDWFDADPATGLATLLGACPGGRIVAALPTCAIGPKRFGLRAVPGPELRDHLFIRGGARRCCCARSGAADGAAASGLARI